jgi:hypothetical protein
LKLKKAILALLFLSFLSSSSVVSAAPENSAGGTYRKFVIYYGWYSDGDGRLGHDIDRIIKSKPEYVVSPFYTSSGQVNLTPAVISKFHDGGVGILAYIATGNAGRNLDSVISEIKTGMEAGAAGVMLDEVALLDQRWQVEYYEKIYEYVKSYGNDMAVVANPGSILVSESVMSVSDIVCFEHQWRLASALDWFSKYPPQRFMGISSNDISGVMGYGVDEETGLRDTMEAWQGGIGYHYSTDSYTRLPAWFEEYQAALGDFAAASSRLGEVTVEAHDTEGNPIDGMWIEVSRSGRTVATGFTPAKFLLPEGSHEIIASNYQNYIFSNWQDGSSQPRFSVAASEDNPVEVTATYRNERAEILVDSVDLAGVNNDGGVRSIKGMHVAILHGGSTVVEGRTPLRMELPIGTYSVTATGSPSSSSASRYYEFEHWSDGSRANTTTISLSTDTTVVAYYSNAIGDRLGIFQCTGNHENFKGQVAESLLSSGAFASSLELHMRRSLASATTC